MCSCFPLSLASASWRALGEGGRAVGNMGASVGPSAWVVGGTLGRLLFLLLPPAEPGAARGQSSCRQRNLAVPLTELHLWAPQVG